MNRRLAILVVLLVSWTLAGCQFGGKYRATREKPADALVVDDLDEYRAAQRAEASPD